MRTDLCLIAFCTLITCSVYGQPIPQKGLVAVYYFDSSAKDIGPSGFHGTVKGARLTEGRNMESNGAYYFDGIDDYIEFPIGDSLPTQERTISVWIKPDYLSLNAERSVLGYGGDGNCGTSFMMVLNNEQSKGLETQQHCRVNRLISSFTTNLESNWHCWTVVTQSKGIDYYLDGELIASNTSFSYQTSTASKHQLFLGEISYHNGSLYHNPSDIQSFKGSIDELSIYNRALSFQEIRSFSKSGSLCDSIIYDTLTVTLRDTITVHDTLIIDRRALGLAKLPGNILLYPNPAKDHLQIRIENHNQFNSISLKLTNSTGTIVWTTAVSNNVYQVDISKLSKGLYFFQVIGYTGKPIETRKIVIQ